MGGIKIKLSANEVEALDDWYRYVLPRWESETKEEELVFAHAYEMSHRLKIMVAKGQQRNLVTFKVTEAYATTLFINLVMNESVMNAYTTNLLLKVNSGLAKFLADQRTKKLVL